MKIKNIIMSMLAAATMLLSSCTAEQPTSEVKSDKGNIRFSLSGAIGGGNAAAPKQSSLSTRGGGLPGTRAEIQTADEKKVTGLYAVVFKDVDNAVATGATGGESEADTFYKMFDVLSLNNQNELQADTDYYFKLEDDGQHYLICFVANPGDDMKKKLKKLTTSSTVKEFKELLEDKVTPETKPGMLMTSEFIGAVPSVEEVTDLGPVHLKRAMARIDIVNQADGITITKVVFKNRSKQTVLISDNADAFKNDYLEATKEYNDVNLAGNSNNSTEYKEQIYSYEQYGKDAAAPSLEITYTLDGKSYRHVVKFVTAKTKEPITLKRNTLYKVVLSNPSAIIKFSLTTAPWGEDETFHVAIDDLTNALAGAVTPGGGSVVPSAPKKPDYTNTAAGDFMLKDGTTVKPDALQTAQQQDVIGIVAYMYKTESNARLKEGVKNALNAKGVAEPHGLVMALKNAATSAAWRTSNTKFGELKGTWKDSYATGTDGYTLTTNIWNANKLDEFPAFEVPIAYGNKVESPINTTDWYIPSAGEWIDILGDKGLQALSQSITNEAKNLNTYYKNWSGAANTAISILNQKMNKVGTSNFDAFALSQWYWSSSECSSDSAYYVGFGFDGDFYCNYPNRTCTYYVRPIFAF